MKKRTLITLALTAVMSLTASAVAMAAESGIISVSGRGVVSAKPDIASITIGVIEEHEDAKIAQAENAKKMEQVLETVKALGIEDKDLKTSNFSVNPNYDYNNRSQITGYSVSNSLTITVRDIDKTGEIIDKAMNAGANYVGQIYFTLDDDSVYYGQALESAIESANKKAKAIAGSIGVTIGKPVSITETSYGGAVYYSSSSYDKSMGNGAADTGALMIEQGELEITARITVEYEY